MTPADPRPTPPARPPRAWVGLVAALYLAFVVYGSLVPLAFRPMPLDMAWAAFADIRYLRLGIGSRADWVANVLLFVPMAFVGLAWLWSARHRGAQVLATLAVLAFCAALCVTIEFTQMFFPPRTVSLNDIVAECLGAAIGVAAWWAVGPRVERWLSGWARARSEVGIAARLLAAYLFVLFAYGVLPLDLTISPVELFHKWREGKVVLLPFSASFPSVAQRVYDLLSDTALWVPVAWLWRRALPRGAGAVVARVLATAALLELLQLFVYSRVTDVTDVLTAGIGGALGAWLAGAIGAGRAHAPADRALASGQGASAGRVVGWWLVLAGIVALQCAVFWYPFDFRTDWAFVRERVLQLQRAPLTAYYYGTEFRAVTEVLHKVGFFLPLGAWLALGADALRRRPGLPMAVVNGLALAVVAAVAALVIAGRILLPSKYPDPVADGVLQLVGGWGAYWGLGWVLQREGRHAIGRTAAARRAESPDVPARPRMWRG